MFLIGEIGINANGDIKLAKDLIRLAKSLGWDAVKFQKRTIDIVYRKKFLDSPRKSQWGTTQRHQKQGLEFNFNQYEEIDLFCRINKIPWFASAWDLNSLEFLERFNVPYHKVASAFITNLQFLHAVAKIGKKTFISTGMCDIGDISKAADVFRSRDCPFVLMHCVSTYPCEPQDCNIEFIRRLKDLFPNTEIGYSGHEGGIAPTIAAMVCGATVIERHITLNRNLPGSDQAASLGKPGMIKVAEFAEEIEVCMGDGNKTFSEAEREVARKLRYWEK
jgi:N-acetylneuraminate synthase